MITDNQTNFLYLADTLPIRYPDFCKRFEHVLKESNILFGFLPQTKDVWAVDYMPIQTDLNKFIRFLYLPSYLTKYKKYANTISDVDTICKDIGIETIKTNIIIDGGNVTRWTNKVIMTDRIFKDNPTYERNQLIKELYELLQVDKLYFVPEQPGDFTGHSDGMVRFVDENTVIINDYENSKKEKEWFCRAFGIAIHNTGLDFIKIPYNVYDNKSNDHANGDYINYLQMENTVIIPTFGIKEDDVAVRQLETIFAGQKIQTIESNEIAYDGGILNCITWNIKMNKHNVNCLNLIKDREFRIIGKGSGNGLYKELILVHAKDASNPMCYCVKISLYDNPLACEITPPLLFQQYLKFGLWFPLTEDEERHYMNYILSTLTDDNLNLIGWYLNQENTNEI